MSLYDSKAAPNPGGHRDVTVADLNTALTTVELIDVREPSEFSGELGHIEGARLVPLATLLNEAQGWPKAPEYVMVCRSGGRSATAAMALTKLGFGRVMNLVGGMLAWNGAGLAVER